MIVTAAFLLLRKKNKKRRNSMAFAGLDIFSPSAHNEKFPPNNDSGNLAGGDPAIMGGAAAAAGAGAGAAGSAAAAKATRRASGADGEGGLWAGAGAGAAAAGGRRKSARGGNEPVLDEEDSGAFGGGRIDPCE